MPGGGLSEGQPAGESGVQGNTVFEDLGITAVEPVDADAGIGGGGGYLLGLDTGAFVEHHADVAGFHIAFFFQFFSVDKLYMGREVPDGPVAAGGGYDDFSHFFTGFLQ